MALVVVMGVTGSGKTTVGTALAERMGVPFADADDFHSPENVAKMRSGVPLTDVDRRPWLLAIGAWLAKHDEGAVVTCSALKRVYRDTLREAAPTITFLHLHGDKDTVRARVAARKGHFMPQSLVDSQYADLEPLEADEKALVVDFALPVEVIVDRVASEI
ncbi:gluconokinase [Actinophytocola algeriensis]|uniref:Gluconokinase n=1 Tax=Actinophytocola algeriensis TaxID=1768010 RepID=A0A7W7Q016_9PSEU|nr:gluconokinase [Actinophytocola algeriensis]MBB4904472.1 gluconokinase [Actinophytocola algeriensis]MBE1476669.1 gluconokinase [Actinophytocola algeriensis]